MALQSIPGSGAWLPTIPELALPPAFAVGTIDASGEKVSFNGRVWYLGSGASKNLTRVGFRFATVVKSNGSTLTVSLQDVNAGTGPPAQPDETQDQTVAIANANAAFVSNTWIRTDAFSATRTVAKGDPLAVVIEFNSFVAGDSVQICVIQAASAGQTGHLSCALKTGGTWATLSGFPNVLLEFDDGTYGVLDGGFAFSALNFISFASNTAVIDEYANEITLTGPWGCDGLWAIVYGSGTSDLEFVLYSGTTALKTVAFDGNMLAAASDYRVIKIPIAQESLSANTVYKLGIRPTTTNAIRVYYADVNDAAYWAAMEGGTGMQLNTRLDQGAWIGVTATRRLFAGFRISAIGDDAGGSGGRPEIRGANL